MFAKINRAEEQMYRNGNREGAMESLIGRFNRRMQASGILKDCKHHEFHEKPSIRKRRKARESLLRNTKKGKGKPFRRKNHV